MANCILSWTNRVDGATFVTDSQTATLPASNLADPIHERVWRTSGATDAYVEIDFGASYDIRVLCLAGLDISATDTIRHRLSNVSAGAGELLDTGAVASGVAEGYGIAPHILSAAVTARYWRIDISAPSRAANGFFSVGRAWADEGFQPTKNISFGLSETWLDSSEVSQATRSGVQFVDNLVQRRGTAFSLGFLTEAEAKDDLREMQRLVGVRNQIFFIPDPDSTRAETEAIIGRMTSVSPILYPSFEVRSKAFQILESK